MPVSRYQIYRTIMMTDGSGVAQFVAAAPELFSISDSMTNKREFNYPRGTYIKVGIRYRHGDKRYIIGTAEWVYPGKAKGEAPTVVDYLNYFSGQMSYLKERCDEGESDKIAAIHPRTWNVMIKVINDPFTISADTKLENLEWDDHLKEKYGKFLVAVKPDGTFTPLTAATAGFKVEVTPAKAEPRLEGRLPDSELGKISSFGSHSLRIRRGAWELMESMLKTVNNNDALPTAILMVGPSGWGKTSIPQAFAEEKGMKFLRVDCANIRDPEEWIGYREAHEGSTIFVKSELVATVEEGNAVIVFDEVNRVEPWMTNTLFSMLDHARRIVAHGEEIHVADNVLFFASANIGGRFVGTFAIDAAFMNRFAAVLKVEPLPANHEVRVLVERTGIDEGNAEVIVRIANAIRKFDDQNNIGLDASLRTTLKICNLLQTSRIGALSVFDLTIMNLVDDEAVVKQLIDIVRPILHAERML